MSDTTETYACDTCGARTDGAGAVRRETMGGLDPDRWRTLCCPECGARLKTVLVRQ